jgi:hypothetical protein
MLAHPPVTKSIFGTLAFQPLELFVRLSDEDARNILQPEFGTIVAISFLSITSTQPATTNETEGI